MDDMKISPLAAVVMIGVAVLAYQTFGWIESWVIETLCRELVRCQ